MIPTGDIETNLTGEKPVHDKETRKNLSQSYCLMSVFLDIDPKNIKPKYSGLKSSDQFRHDDS